MRTGGVLGSLYREAGVVVCPSSSEGLPLVALEAASAGACIVASDIPAHLEVLGPRAITFPSGDAAALRDSLARLMHNPSALEACRAALDAGCNAEYDWDAVAQRTHQLLAAL